MSEERAPYYVGNLPQIPLVRRPETWQTITFSDGSTLEVMTRSPNKKTLAVQWAQVLERWLNEQLEAEDLFGPS